MTKGLVPCTIASKATSLLPNNFGMNRESLFYLCSELGDLMVKWLLSLSFV